MTAAAIISVLFVIAIGREVAKGGAGRGLPAGRFVGWVSLTLVILMLIGFKDLHAAEAAVGGFIGGIGTAASSVVHFVGQL